MISSISSKGMSRNGPYEPTPALITAMSTPPCLSAVASTSRRIASGSRTSVGMATASGMPRSSPLRDAKPSLAPASWRARATAAPMPRLAPVTTATRPSNEDIRDLQFSASELFELVLGDLSRHLADDDHGEDFVHGDVVLVHRAHQPALEHDADPVRQVEHVVDVVGDEDDPDPLRLEAADQVRHLLGLGRAEGRGRLVHDQDAGVEVHRPGDCDRLPLAARQPRHRDLEVLELRVEA